MQVPNFPRRADLNPLPMAATPNAWCTVMHDTMCGMTAAVAALAAISLPNPRLKAQIALMRAPQHVLLQSSSMAAPLPREQYILFVADFVTLLTALVPQLERMTVRLNAELACSKSEEAIFWELWRLLLTSCTAFENTTDHATDALPVNRQPLYTSLYPALHAMLTWLLTCSRTPAWLAMRQEHGLRARNSELLLILTQPAKCLINLGLGDPSALQPNLRAGPPDFIPLLCCIVTEQYSSAPRIVPLVAQVTGGLGATTYAQSFLTFLPVFASSLHEFLSNLTQAVNNLGFSDSASGYSGVSLLQAPAIVQLFKAIMIKPERYIRKPPNDLMTSTITPLHDIYFNAMSAAAADGPRPGSTVNRNAAGLPLHLNPHASPAALETDSWLLHALSKLTVPDRDTAEMLRALQAMIVQDWIQAESRCPAPREVLASMASDIVGVARQCMADGLWLMQAQWDARLGGGQGLRGPVQRRQQQQQQGSTATRSVGGGLGVLSQRGFQVARGLLTSVSSFRHDFVEHVLQPRPGPSFGVLDRWRVMGGWAAAMESLQRGTHHSTTPCEFRNCGSNSLASIDLLRNTDTEVTLAGSISLAATLRKLLWPMMVWEEARSDEVASPMRSVQRMQWAVRQREAVVALEGPVFMSSFLRAVSALDLLHLRAVESGSDTSSGDTSSVSGSSGAIHTKGVSQTCSSRGPGRKPSGAGSSSGAPGGAVLLELDATGCSAGHLLLPLHIHQLQTITLMTLVQLCMWALDSTDLQSALLSFVPGWLVTAVTACKRVANPHLRAAVASLLNDSSHSQPRPSQSESGCFIANIG
ncbi:MAG: hypothetical protein WDW38_009695 [Sanguina aurantia]